MTLSKFLLGVFVLVTGIALTAPASASQFGRVGLDYLVAENETIVVGEVRETYSYWNAPGTFILTDAKIVVSEVLKGDRHLREVTVTLPGGSVDELSTVVVGGAELKPGSSYLLFLHRGDLPGAPGVQMVRDHIQGVFELKASENGLRAVSQASADTLLPDASGVTEAPGGKRGLRLEAMKETVRELTAHGRQEVK